MWRGFDVIEMIFKDLICICYCELRSYLIVIFALVLIPLIESGFAESGFSITLPQNWIQRPGIPYAYANQEVQGNYILVSSNNSPKDFGARDDFHGFMKSEYMKSGFGLAKSITTISTDYGYKSIIEIKLKKGDGSIMTIRKDYHYVDDEEKLFQIHGYSSNSTTKAELLKTLNSFRPL